MPGLTGFYDVTEKRIFFVPPLTRSNPYQQRRLATRCILQLEVEGVSLYDHVHDEFAKSYLQRLRRSKTPYRSIPQPERIAIVLSRDGSRVLPEEPDKRHGLLMEWIANIPPNKRIGGSNSFGGEHSGFRFEPDEPGRNIKLSDEVDQDLIEAQLESDGREWRSDDTGNIFILGADNIEAKNYVEHRFVDFPSVFLDLVDPISLVDPVD